MNQKFKSFLLVLCVFLLIGSLVSAQGSYVVKKGDTLSGISQRLYGTSVKWRIIYEANKDVIKSPHRISPGWSLKTPNIEVPPKPDEVSAEEQRKKTSEVRPPQEEMTKLTFLYFNDFHGALEPTIKKRKIIREGKEIKEKYEVYGIARMATMVKTIRKANKTKGIPTFFVNTGDFLQGSFLSNEFLGRIEAELYDKMELSFYTVGNHELDFGHDNLLKVIDSVKAPCVTANYKISGKPIGNPIIREEKGVKIGIAGLAAMQDYSLETPKVDPVFLKEVQLDEEFQKAENLVADFKNKGVDLIVLLTHIGIERDKELAREVKGIDVIIGADSHSKIESYVKVGGTYIVQAEAYGKYLGQMNLSFKNGKLTEADAKLIKLDEKVKPDTEIADIIRERKADLKKRTGEIIAHNDCPLEGEKAVIRSRETNLGNFVTDVLRAYFRTDIAIYNSGGIRYSIDDGDITFGDIHKALPFPTNRTHILDISGEELKAALDYNASQVDEGGFLQVSGMNFILEPNVGVRDVRVNGQALEPDKIYTLVTNSYIATGGDGYKMLKKIPAKRRRYEPNPTPIIANYVKKHYGKADKRISYCKPEGRIIMAE